MKEKLRNHIKSIFQSIGIDATFEVYEYAVDIQPLLARAIGLSQQFLICSTASLYEEYKDKLEALLGKTISSSNGIISWAEGEFVDTEDEKQNVADSRTATQAIPARRKLNKAGTYKKMSYSCAVLPEWLDQRIFEKMGCSYSPSGVAQEFNRNLELSLAMIKKYLGTYLPRSYAETFCIFDNLFSNPIVKKAYYRKRNLKALCIGIGTGGDTLGFLDALAKHFPNLADLQITAIDGNADASSISEALVEEAKDHMPLSIDIQIIRHVFSSFESIDDKLKGQCKVSEYDFVFTSKMINELISSGNEGTLESFGYFVKSFLPLLNEKGLLLLLDITSKPDSIDTFIPLLMNKQVNLELKNITGFQTVLPIPCSFYENVCDISCFTQKTFYVTHSRKELDKSKVCFRVIARSGFASDVLSNDAYTKDKSYIKSEEQMELCPFGLSSGVTADGFTLRSYSASSDPTPASSDGIFVEPCGMATIGQCGAFDSSEKTIVTATKCSQEWQDVFSQLLDDEALKYAKRLSDFSKKAPSVIGFELTDARGAVLCEAEMAWEDEKIVFLLPHQMCGKESFEKAGWNVVTHEDRFSQAAGGANK